ncbi:MAG: hypothetical protein U5N55_01480 [Cypionkella sp.]|nr:hypothetical protein [Cypionkella sp.]
MQTIKQWAIGIVAVLSAILAAFAVGKREGKTDERAKQSKHNLESANETHVRIDRAQSGAVGSDADIVDRLRSYGQ